ncbi:MAG: 5-formyltetrahydrofolate cyclo-ligase [Gammaproteobacteria bacterium]|nr:5-formyltetrahydrofolate cyclo-ligase [Gammaproteobacteria bacterium]
MQSSLARNKQVRSAMRARRNSQAVSIIQEKSETIALSISSKLRNLDLKVVACYRAQDGEVKLESVVKSLFSSHIKVVIPVVRNQSMQFSLIEANSKFIPGPFGIEEPTDLSFVDPFQIDLVLAPLVAFSSTGQRLGRGGGYYDQIFIDNDKTAFVGVAYDFQLSDEFGSHANDKQLDAVVTETGWRVFSNDKLEFDSSV